MFSIVREAHDDISWLKNTLRERILKHLVSKMPLYSDSFSIFVWILFLNLL